jgi:hypothetical protein
LLLNAVPDNFDIDTDSDGHICSVLVCECDEKGVYLTLDCRLSPMPDHEPGTFEFSFGFTKADIEGAGEAYFTQDRDEVRAYLAGLPVDHILPTVREALCALVEHVQPAYIYRVTKGRSLPQKAMVKHQMVTDTLYGLGYSQVDAGTDRFDRTFWFMSR